MLNYLSLSLNYLDTSFFLIQFKFKRLENLEFVESETLRGVANPQNVATLHLGVARPEHAAPLHLGAVLLVPVQLDLQLEGPGTAGASLPEKKKQIARQKRA